MDLLLSSDSDDGDLALKQEQEQEQEQEQDEDFYFLDYMFDTTGLLKPPPNKPGARRKKRKRKTAAPATPAPSLPTGRRTGKVIPLELKNGSYASLGLQQKRYHLP